MTRKPATQLRPATLLTRTLAAAIDLALSWIAFCLLLKVLRYSPVPRPEWALLIPVGAFLTWILPLSLLGVSVGEMIWQVRSGGWLVGGRRLGALPDGARAVTFLLRELFRLRRALLEPAGNSPRSRLGATFLTLASFLGFALSTQIFFLQSPYWKTASPMPLSPFLPLATTPASTDAEAAPLESGWSIAPFYYALGAWPRSFRGKPIFYTLPYEKGPPERFIGKIHARWAAPDVRVTFEGPRSPLEFRNRVPQVRLRHCLLTPPLSISCLRLREEALGRHLKELQALRPERWEISWLIVENPALPHLEQTQGIYLSARNDDRGQDRFIVVTPQGTHQAFILEYPATPVGDEARELFQKAIRSFRVSDELAPGRAWVERRIQGIRLEGLHAMDDSVRTPLFLAAIGDIHQLLLSKISVDPKTLDSFYHLAGTSLLLMRHASRNSAAVTLHMPDWSVVTKSLIKSSYDYARDVKPGDARLKQLENTWLDSQKF